MNYTGFAQPRSISLILVAGVTHTGKPFDDFAISNRSLLHLISLKAMPDLYCSSGDIKS